MKVGVNYKIESDGLNITIFERRISRKTNKEYWVSIGYYSSVANALRGLVDLEVAKTTLKEFKVVVGKQEELYKLIGGLNNVY